MKSSEAPNAPCTTGIRTLSLTVALSLASGALLPGNVGAQGIRPAPLEVPEVPATANALATPENIEEQIQRGRALLEAGDVRAVKTLEGAAQASLGALAAVAGSNILSTTPDKMPPDGVVGELGKRTATAHYWWGRAADQFAQRDIAITALSRAARFAGAYRFGGSNTLARDVMLQLGGTLREGLPLVAPDDTVEAIAGIAHGGLWQPRRFSFDFSGVDFNPGSKDEKTPPQEFMITSGKLFPPVPSTVAPGTGLAVVPPLYRLVPNDSLPPVLRMDKMVAGYKRETSGPNRGLWRQVVRVFYSSPYLTKDKRDDRPRAEALCAYFLRVHALMRAGLGVENPFVRAGDGGEGVTTLWLAEVSAQWPNDDDDPEVQSTIGVRLPKANTPMSKDPKKIDVAQEIETTPLTAPFAAAGQIAMTGDIIFFKMTQPRDEFEWAREIAHEYGHMALPGFNHFKPPLEPYGNGLLGETLAALWLGSTSTQFGGEVQSSGVQWVQPISAGGASWTPAQGFSREVADHVVRNAIQPRSLWTAQGPSSVLRTDTSTSGLRYLQGLAVYVERVYGAQILGATFRPLVERPKFTFDGPTPAPKPIATGAFYDSLSTVLRDPFDKDGKLDIYLPAALEGVTQGAAEFAGRAPMRLKANERLTCWLYVPPSADSLRLQWQNVGIPASIRSEGWRIANAVGNATIDTTNRSGWQRFAFTPSTDITLTGARFEKK